MEYQYCQNPTSETPIMVIDRHIGMDMLDGQGIDGSQFAKELMSLDASGVAQIDVWINSVGGEVVGGMSIYNAILNSKAKVNTICVGLCASISAVIFMAGRKRIMSDFGILMFHDPYNIDGSVSKITELMRQSIATMISERSTKSKDEVLNLMSIETWLDSSDALDYGFATDIKASGSTNKQRQFQSVKEAYNCFNSALNVTINNNQPTTNLKMDKVCNKLSLVKGSTEEVILDAISKIEADSQAKAVEITTLKNSLTDLNSKIETLTSERNSFEAKVLASEIEIENAKNEALKINAKTLIDSFEAKGLIKKETAEKWLNLAIADFDGTKEILEGLPLNITAKRIDTQNSVTNNSIGSYIHDRLKNIKK